jgi:hypothetical protein
MGQTSAVFASSASKTELSRPPLVKTAILSTPCLPAIQLIEEIKRPVENQIGKERIGASTAKVAITLAIPV